MAAPDAPDAADTTRPLFDGVKFWVAQRVFSRNRLVDNIRNNGGLVVMREKEADYLIADHFRRDCPPGSISYTWIDQSLKDGVVADAKDHTAGPPLGATRAVASAGRPAKKSRIAYTAEDDRILYKWVLDHESAGGKGSIAGNELYKQLENKYPRHSWQSWRDRYLKHVKDHPPQGAQVPQDAPQDAASSPAADQTNSPPKSLDALRALFSEDDFEELYANAEILIESNEDAQNYRESWERWADFRKSQTAGQWRRYFENFVRPQWERDPESKRQIIRDKVYRKHEEEEGIAAADARAERKAEEFTKSEGEKALDIATETAAKARESSHHSVVSDTRETGPVPTESVDSLPIDRTQTSSQSRLQTEEDNPTGILSTRAQQRPDDIRKEHLNPMKRIHDHDPDDMHPLSKSRPSSRDIKRRKRDSPEFEKPAANLGLAGSQNKPLQILSGDSSSSLDSDNTETQERTTDSMIQAQIENEEQENASLDEPTPSIEHTGADFPGIDETAASLLPPDTPTSRPTGRKAAFDTQAILSSPMHEFALQALPRPERRSPAASRSASPASASSFGNMDIEPLSRPRPHTPAKINPQRYTPPLQTSSPPMAPDSITSPTQSLQEFRQTLMGADDDAPYPTQPSVAALDSPTLNPLPRPPQQNSSPAEPLSTHNREEEEQEDEDPDPPLQHAEYADFVAEQISAGFTKAEIKAALKVTCCRPELAVEVLDAWAEGKDLPMRRGIWSVEDDGDLFSEDATVLKRLEDKHSWDGWGGVEERNKFLHMWNEKERKRRISGSF